MMEIDNDKLLRDFFAAEKKEVADKGFTHRVMRQLPDRKNRLAQVWSVFVMLTAIVLFVLLGGIDATLVTLQDVCADVFVHVIANLDPKSAIIAAVVLLFLATRKICSLA